LRRCGRRRTRPCRVQVGVGELLVPGGVDRMYLPGVLVALFGRSQLLHLVCDGYAATRSESAHDQAGGRAPANVDQLGRSSLLSRAHRGNQWSGWVVPDGFGRGPAMDWCRRRPDRRRRDGRSLVAPDTAAVGGSQVVDAGQMAIPLFSIIVIAAGTRRCRRQRSPPADKDAIKRQRRHLGGSQTNGNSVRTVG
jgi:hypothetical protein